MADERPATPSSTRLEAWKQLGGVLFEVSPEQPLEVLQQRLRETGTAPKEGSGGPHVLVDAAVLAQAIERHAAQLRGCADSRIETMRGLLLALLAHLEGVHTRAGDCAQLAQIRDRLAACPQELELVPEMLSRCLSSLSNDFAEASSPVLAARKGTASGAVSDPCTGLPLKAEAEAALQRAVGSPQIYVAVFYVHRMHLINARFGENIGNEILLYCSQHLATSLVRPSDLLFRWMGPAFVAILDRPESPVVVAAEVRRAVSTPLSRFFDNASRTMYLPVKLSAETIAASSLDPCAVTGQVAQFIHHASRTS